MKQSAGATIRDMLGAYVDYNKRYPARLHVALTEWYCYTVDGGHSILAALKSAYTPDADPSTFLAPVPVKTVLRGYAITEDGYILVDVPYDPELGLITDPADAEY